MVLAIAHGPFNVHDINGRSTSLVCRGRTPRFVQKWDPEMAISMTKMIINYYTLRVYSFTPKFLDLIPVQGSRVTDPEDARQWKWTILSEDFPILSHQKGWEFPMDFPLPSYRTHQDPPWISLRLTWMARTFEGCARILELWDVELQSPDFCFFPSLTSIQ